MQWDNISLFNNLPIHHKLRMVSAIPLGSLILVSIVTLNSVQTFSEAEERLNNLYLTQKTAAEYMRLVVDLETGFRGYVLTVNERDLEPYQNALTDIRVVEKELNDRLVEGHQTDIQEHEFKNLQALVNQLNARRLSPDGRAFPHRAVWTEPAGSHCAVGRLEQQLPRGADRRGSSL